jgi:hypothetical protein
VGLEEILAGAAALITGVGAIYIAVHEVRRRERRVTRQEIHDLTDEIEALRHLLLEQRRYIYKVATMLVDHGFDVPTPPAPAFDPDEY